MLRAKIFSGLVLVLVFLWYKGCASSVNVEQNSRHRMASITNWHFEGDSLSLQAASSLEQIPERNRNRF